MVVQGVETVFSSHVNYFRLWVFFRIETECVVGIGHSGLIVEYAEFLGLSTGQFDGDIERLIVFGKEKHYRFDITFLAGGKDDFVAFFTSYGMLASIAAMEKPVVRVYQSVWIDALQFVGGGGRDGHFFVLFHITPLGSSVEPAFYASTFQVETCSFQGEGSLLASPEPDAYSAGFLV